jgi:hypothetical protein
MGRANRTPKKGWRPAFLEALAGSANVRAACAAAGVGRSTAYDHRGRDGRFAEAWDDALDEACDVLEAEARRRAVKWTERPVYQGGERVGAVREYSDTLLIFLLKANRPEKYRDSYDIKALVRPAGQPGH